ncbi:MAG: pentapeptide repeat-containing protein [Gloeomargaritaceae cyanobacterium C42_A2020_066]|nr:pentapeptide repeat-containing protein [Gloeomargaritaceae cyanobacterium C42_A2020_066]
MDSLLQSLLDYQHQSATGVFRVTAGQEQWQLYLFFGRLLYATGGRHRVRRWARYLKLYAPAYRPAELTAAVDSPWEYTLIAQGLAQGYVTLSQAKSIVQSSVQEVLFHVLTTEDAQTEWQPESPLTQQIVLIQIDRALEEARSLHSRWQEVLKPVRGLLRQFSPDVALHLRHPESLSRQVSPQVQQVLTQILDGQHTLWDMAALTKQSLPTVTRFLLDLVQQSIVDLTDISDLPAPVTPPPVATTTAPVGPLVACLDDSPLILQTLERILRPAGYRTLALQDPMAQMALLLEHRPDLILLDWVMPNVNGYELCGLLRKTAAFKDTPIILLTANEGLINRTRARLAGATELLQKPVREGELLQLLERFLPRAAQATVPPQPVGRTGTIAPQPLTPVEVNEQPQDIAQETAARVADLLKRYAAGEREFGGLSLVGADLRDQDLSGANLSRAELMLADLSRCQLVGTKLVGANLIGCELQQANLEGAGLTGANLIGADLSQTNLNYADLGAANLSTANLRGSRLRRANLNESLASGADLAEADLGGAKLYAANLNRADLSQANCSGADFTGANLWQATLDNTNLEGADLTGAVLPS